MAVWLKPKSVDTKLIVNREAEIKDLAKRLTQFREEGQREAHLLVTGARGVGKSIFTRAVLARLETADPAAFVSVVVDSRGAAFRPFLNTLARDLVAALRRKGLVDRAALAKWLDQLELLANSTQIRTSQIQGKNNRYGVDATVGADLLVKLSGRFAWEESRNSNVGFETTVTVTDTILHDAINATLVRLTEADCPWFVVLFLDDLDQIKRPSSRP